MAIKIINSFDVSVKAFDKDYYARIYHIKTPYKLKAGNRIFRVNYQNRGIVWDDVKILEITDTDITIGDHWLYKDMVFTLRFDQEPNYDEIFWESYLSQIKPEKRQLIFQPFPLFNKLPDFKSPKKWTLEDFYTQSGCDSIKDIEFKEYLRNFENLVNMQISLI